VRFKVWSILTSLVLVVGAAVFTGPAAQAHGAHRTAFSGYELSAGHSDGSTTRGASFGGWAHDGEGWLPPAGGGQSSWAAIVDYSGTAGLHSAVILTGGYWAWRAVDGTVHAGTVRDGRVVWPDTRVHDIGCGAGIARISANLAPEGTLSGCLDDSHIPQVFPPKAWGTLNLR
jgi:hypothetical protein